MMRRALWAMAMLLLAIPAFAQSDTDAEFEKLVMKGLESHLPTYLSAMAPTLDDCKAVFKGDAAQLVLAHSKDMCAEFGSQGDQLADRFVDFRIAKFKTEEALTDRTSVTGGMRDARDHLLPGITFYQVSYLRETGAEFGVTYRYFVKVGDHWVFFPKPWRAFQEN